MALTDELFALVPSDQVDHLTAALRHRLGPDDIEVRRPERGRYPVRDVRLHEDVSAARRGGVIGAGAGAVAGVVVAALVNPIAAQVWVLLAFCGAAFGALAGGVVGLQRRDVPDDVPDVETPVEDPNGVRLLTVRSEHHLLWAHHVLERTPGVRFLRQDVPTSR